MKSFMKNLKWGLAPALLVGASLLSTVSYAALESIEANQKRWAQYCGGGTQKADSAVTPIVNYGTDKVDRAAVILSNVADISFYFYGGPLRAYGLDKASVPSNFPKAGNQKGAMNAHKFLTILCGEFRDRATLMEDKLEWVLSMNKMSAEPQKDIDINQSLWPQVSAHSYQPYLSFSQQLWAQRHSKITQIKIGQYNVDQPVDGQTVCAAKYIFKEYIIKNKGFDSLANYDAGFEKFAKNCSQADREDYYDFRGDSNFKPNSPEANGMIWYSSSITTQCATTTKAKGGTAVTDEVCQNYFRHPFASRWNAARSGLASWMVHDKQFDTEFSNTKSMVYILGKVLPTGESESPFPYRLSDGQQRLDTLSNWTNSNWQRVDFGFNFAAGLGSASPDSNLTYERLRDAVNRHTDWYASGFFDGMGMDRNQAYSPFVASSYEMSASNAFTAAGYTVPGPTDGKKHWMFVFRIKGKNWYTSESAKNGQPVDFDKNWFDETSLGTNGLAKSEHAWDRLGTALEDELDTILYLHNITTGGQVQAD